MHFLQEMLWRKHRRHGWRTVFEIGRSCRRACPVRSWIAALDTQKMYARMHTRVYPLSFGRRGGNEPHATFAIEDGRKWYKSPLACLGTRFQVPNRLPAAYSDRVIPGIRRESGVGRWRLSSKATLLIGGLSRGGGADGRRHRAPDPRTPRGNSANRRVDAVRDRRRGSRGSVWIGRRNQGIGRARRTR
jgi:hypothetical protein